MDFGKRFSRHNRRPAPVIKQTCERCSGTGRIRERGHQISCKVCGGTGKVSAKIDRAS